MSAVGRILKSPKEEVKDDGRGNNGNLDRSDVESDAALFEITDHAACCIETE
jgi:hypothetical protein